MSQQVTFSSDQFQTSVSLENVEDTLSSSKEGEDAYKLNAEIALDEEADTRTVVWDIVAPVTHVDRSSELLDHLNADADAVLSLVREHTDLRTTKIGSDLGDVIVDEDGDIIRYELRPAYPNAPSVKIAHEELEEDLFELNPE